MLKWAYNLLTLIFMCTFAVGITAKATQVSTFRSMKKSIKNLVFSIFICIFARSICEGDVIGSHAGLKNP